MFKLASLFVDVTANTNNFDAAMGRIRGRMTGILALGAAAGGGIGFGLVKAVGVASDLAETLNKVQVVFGGASGNITSFAQAMADKFGLVKNTVLDAVSGIGLIGKAAGQSQSQAAALGIQMGKLAADAASFYNVPLDVALEKIRAGLIGEAEPLRAFGVLLDEESVKLQGVAMGYQLVSGQLTAQQKVMARAAIIMKQTTDAQGDLERTSGGYANQTRELWGRLENLAASIGAELLPAFTDLIQLFNEVASSASTKFGLMRTVIDGFKSYFQSFVDFLGSLYHNWGDYFEIVHIKFQELVANLQAEMTYMVAIFQSGGTFIKDNFLNIYIDMFAAAETIVANGFKNLADLMAANLKQSFGLGGPAKLRPLLDGFKALAQDFGKSIKPPEFVNFQDKIDAIGAKIAANDARLAANKRAGGLAGAGAGAVPPEAPLERAGKKQSFESQDVLSWLKSIQAAQLGKTGPAQETAKNTAKMVALAVETKDLLGRVAKTTPLGLAAPG
jgi:hypothetical protein